MASEEATSRLDPALLDEIIEELDLEEASTIDRLNGLFDDFGEKVWEWLKSLSGGEDGWLNRLNDWLRDKWPASDGDSPIADFTPVMTLLSWLSVVLLIALLGYVAYWLWGAYRPRRVQPRNLVYERLRAQAAVPVAALSVDKQPAALFARVCLKLADSGRLQIQPDSTHQMLAATADVSATERGVLVELAEAADRGLFGGWRPQASELAELVGLSRRFAQTEDVAAPERSGGRV